MFFLISAGLLLGWMVPLQGRWLDILVSKALEGRFHVKSAVEGSRLERWSLFSARSMTADLPDGRRLAACGPMGIKFERSIFLPGDLYVSIRELRLERLSWEQMPRWLSDLGKAAGGSCRVRQAQGYLKKIKNGCSLHLLKFEAEGLSACGGYLKVSTMASPKAHLSVYWSPKGQGTSWKWLEKIYPQESGFQGSSKRKLRFILQDHFLTVRGNSGILFQARWQAHS